MSDRLDHGALRDHRLAVITGGEGGLARALRSALLGAGWTVCAPGRQELDVRRPKDVAAWFAERGPVQLLVNNAGLIRDTPLLRLSEEDWDEVVDTNLKGAFFCSQAAYPGMRERQQGHIVQIGSFSAIRPPVGQAAYAAAKAGLVAMTQSLASEWGADNVRVNCMLPGFLETQMTKGVPPEAVAVAQEAHMLSRFNTVDEVGRFLLELQEQPHVSGQTFQLDSRVRRW